MAISAGVAIGGGGIVATGSIGTAGKTMGGGTIVAGAAATASGCGVVSAYVGNGDGSVIIVTGMTGAAVTVEREMVWADAKALRLDIAACG